MTTVITSNSWNSVTEYAKIGSIEIGIGTQTYAQTTKTRIATA